MTSFPLRPFIAALALMTALAAPANAHYLVSKQVKEGRTLSEISLLDRKSRITEIARMLGGQSEVARKHAEALLR